MKKVLLAFLAFSFATAAQAQFADQRQYASISGGTANAQTVAVPNYALNPGVAIRFVPSFTNNGAMTLNVNGTGVVPFLKQTSSGLTAMSGGEVITGQMAEVFFDGAQYELLNAPASIPSGAASYFAFSVCPLGWQAMDGSAISRTNYAALFAAIGTRYGAGDGTTTFNVPDGRGYFNRQWANGGPIDTGRTLGSTQATQVGTATGPITATSSSSASSTSIFSSGTTSTAALVVGTSGFILSGGASYGFSFLPVTGSVATTTTVTTTTTGTATTNSGNTDNRPVNLALQQCIKL